MVKDKLTLYGETFNSRFLIGSSLYPSPKIMQDAIRLSGADIVTVSVRRESAQGQDGQHFWGLLQELDKRILPNTAGCHTSCEAIKTAALARELFGTDWIKLEVIANTDTLQPDLLGLVAAARELHAQGFKILPYCTEDLSVAEALLKAGCEVLMPWGAPIGTGKGVLNPYAMQLLRSRLPDVPLIVDAGLGTPSHAATVMEWGFDAVLLNSAVARASDPLMMADGFRRGIEAGRLGYLSGLMVPRDMAEPSTPVVGQPFWHYEQT